MRFSIVNGEKREAQKGLIGVCIGCDQPVIPKCGPIKIHHWAHKSNVSVTIGGKMKLNGIVHGKITFRLNAKRSDTELKMVNGILLM